MNAKKSGLRLLPWAGEDGKAAYLAVGDEKDSFMARLADGVESVQLGMAEDLLTWVGEFDVRGASPEELRSVVGSLSESLRDAVRVAQSRGGRLAVTGVEGEDGDMSKVATAAKALIEGTFARPGVDGMSSGACGQGVRR